MKRILLVNDLAQGGGVEKLLLDFVNAWHDKYDLTVLLLDVSKKTFDNSIYPDNVKVICQDQLLEDGNVFAQSYVRFIRHFKNKEIKKNLTNDLYDLVISLKDGWVTKYVADLGVEPKLMWHHTDYNSYYYTGEIFGGPEAEYDQLRKFKHIVCVSETVKQGIIDVVGDPGNLIVKYNPLHVEDILEKSKEIVVDVDKDPNKTYFAVVGRINYQKGYDVLLEAVHMLELDGYDFRVWIVGGTESWSDEAQRLERAVKRLGIKSVDFIGARNNPYKYMKECDWVLSTSLFEGFSYVSQEAALLDKPMLLTDCGGVKELLGDSEYGIVMERSVIGVYNGMKKVLEDKSLHELYQKKISERKRIINFESRMAEIEKIL